MTTIAILLAFAGSFAPLLRLFWRRGRADDPQSDSDDDGGGGNQRREPREPRDSGGGEPPWWPEFECDFADYARGLRVGGR